jgi:hypothetical protein
MIVFDIFYFIFEICLVFTHNRSRPNPNFDPGNMQNASSKMGKYIYHYPCHTNGTEKNT